VSTVYHIMPERLECPQNIHFRNALDLVVAGASAQVASDRSEDDNQLSRMRS